MKGLSWDDSCRLMLADLTENIQVWQNKWYELRRLEKGFLAAHARAQSTHAITASAEWIKIKQTGN